MAQQFCIKCGRMKNESEFYKSRNIEKYPPNGRMNICKDCLTMHVDNWDPSTFLPILEEIDVPYIKSKWDKLLETYGKDPTKLNGTSIIGRYLAGMRIKQYINTRFADTEALREKEENEKRLTLKSQGFTDEDIETYMERDTTPPRPKLPEQEVAGVPEYEDPSQEEDDFSDKLTEEDKLMLRLKWGQNYRPEEWVRMEQLYKDMMKSYDIQSAGHKDTLIMVCKASLKANQLIDAGDIDGFQKMQKAYDSLMKSGKFTAAQIKDEGGEFIDSIGELVALCEKEGFMPRYYTDGPQDKVDRTLQDLQQYTRTLVLEETNLNNMLENALKEINKDREREATIDVEDGEANEEDEMFDYDSVEDLTDDDYEEFEDMITDGTEADNALIDQLLKED